MSSNRSNNTNSSSSYNSKPFCKVCKDAGCSESQYTSHFVKDQPGPNGKVVCPTLLNQSCRICNQLGHTSSYCKQYKPRPSREEPRHQEYRREEPRHQDYRREEPRHQEYRREDYRREEPRHQEYRREEPRREEPPRRAPYAHPHGPRVRLQLESPALSIASPATAVTATAVTATAVTATSVTARPSSVPELDLPRWGTAEYWRLFQTDDAAAADLSRLPVPDIDVRKVDLKTEPLWGDEPLVNMDSEHRRILEDAFMKCLISDEDFDLIVAADEDNGGGRRAINNRRY